MTGSSSSPGGRRIRWVLLSVVSASAATLLLVLHYTGAGASDSVRPRSDLQRGVRTAAEEMQDPPDPHAQAPSPHESVLPDDRLILARLASREEATRWKMLREIARAGPDAARWAPQLLQMLDTGDVGDQALALAALMAVEDDRRYLGRLSRLAARTPGDFPARVLVEADPVRGRALDAAARSLVELEDAGRTDAELSAIFEKLVRADPDVGAHLGRVLANASTEQLRVYAAVALGLDPVPKEAVRELGAVVRRADEESMNAILAALGTSKGEFEGGQSLALALAGRAATGNRVESESALVALPKVGYCDASVADALLKVARARAELAIPVLTAFEQLGVRSAVAVPGILRLGEDRPDLRLAALAALAAAGTEEALPLFESTLDSGNERQREEALRLLPRVQGARRTSALLLALYRRDPDRGLSTLSCIARVDPELSTAPAREAVWAALGDAHPAQRAAVATALRECSRLPEPVALKLVALTEDPDPSVAQAAVASLAGSRWLTDGETTLVARLVLLAQKGRDDMPWARGVFLDTLSRIAPGREDARGAFREALGAKEVKTRLAAIRGFLVVENPTEADREAVRKARRDSDSLVRETAKLILKKPGWGGE